METRLSTRRPAAAVLEDAASVYAAAFAQAPYHEGPVDVDAFRDRVQRYADERDGFRLVTVHDDVERPVAIGLAVLARPGDWWRDQVAAAIGRDDEDRWLGGVCLEVVHVVTTWLPDDQLTLRALHSPPGATAGGLLRRGTALNGRTTPLSSLGGRR